MSTQLVIRHAQMDALDASAWRRYTEHFARELQRLFPERARHMGDAALQQHAHLCVERLRHRCYNRESILKLLSLSLLYGVNFETDPETEWMGAYLRDLQVSDPDERVRRLYTAVLARLRTARSSRQAREAFARG